MKVERVGGGRENNREDQEGRGCKIKNNHVVKSRSFEFES
jgi:hypothetical protein